MIPFRLAAGAALVAAAAALLPGVVRREDGTDRADSAAGALRLVVASLPAGAPARGPGRVPAGGRILLLAPGSATPPRDLAPGFAAAGAPRVSFDGSRVAFAGRRTEGEGDGIWIVDADGGAPRAVAGTAAGSGDPQWLPDGRMLFTAPAPGFAGRAGAPVRALFSVPLDGGEPARLTFRVEGADLDPAVLADGRVLFAAGEGTAGAGPLLAVHNDGTGVHGFHGSRGDGEVRRRPRETGDRGVVLVGGGGRLLLLDARRPGRAPRLLAAEARGSFRSAEPLPGGGFLVSFRPGAGRPTWGLRRLSPGGGAPGAVLLDDPERDEVEAVLLAPRPRPKGHLSLVDGSRTTGRLVCLDVRRGTGLPPGSPLPAAVRIREALPPGDPRGMDGSARRTLGDAPVAEDGSFFVEVPADRPLELDLLAEDGSVLAASGPRFWIRPNETRGCIGCHESPASAPPNVLPAAVAGDAVLPFLPGESGRSR